MKTNMFKNVALATTSLIPLVAGQALAQDAADEVERVTTHVIEGGVSLNTNADAWKLDAFRGEGLTDHGTFIGNAWLQDRDPATGEFYEFRATDLGNEARRMDLKYGTQGKYNINLKLDQLHYTYATSKTYYDGAGSGTLTLPSGFTNQAQATDIINNNNSLLKDLELQTDRYRASLGGSWSPSASPDATEWQASMNNWTFSANYDYEKKEGVKWMNLLARGAANNSGTVGTQFAPEPVDQDTHRMTVKGAYTTKPLQLDLAYIYTHFDNKENKVEATSMFTTAGTLMRGALPPSWDNHTVKGQLGYNVSDDTRVNATLRYSMTYQNDSYLAPSAVAEAASMATMPRQSADSRMDMMVGQLNLYHRLTSDVDITAKYRFAKRENKTALESWTHWIRDDTVAGTQRQNVVWNYQSHQASLQGGYRLSPATRLVGGYEYNQTQRFSIRAEADTVRENILNAKLSHTIGDTTGRVSVSQGRRTANDYDSAGGTDGGLITGQTYPATNGVLDDANAARRFFQTDRIRTEVKANVTHLLDPASSSTIGLTAGILRDDYNRSQRGLLGGSKQHLTLDASTSPTDDLMLTGFITVSGQETELHHDQNLDPGIWRNFTTNAATVGANAEWQVAPDFKLAGNYMYIDTRTMVDYNQRGTIGEHGAIWSRQHILGVNGEYSLEDNLALAMGYTLENIKSYDPHFDESWTDLDGGVAASSIITPFMNAPNQTNHTIMVSGRYNF